MITTLDGKPAQHIVQGAEYFVPTVHGIPIVLPSHIDEGNDGPSGRHWHTDNRWGPVGRGLGVWSEETCQHFRMTYGDLIKSSILKDEGQQIVYEKRTATDTVIWPSGGVFSSMVWLYYQYGDIPAKDGHCAHHHTQLQEHSDGELQCPAHGLRYNRDGSPRFKGPFFIRIRYTDPNDNHQIKWAKEEIQFDTILALTFPVNAQLDPFPRVELVDANDVIVMECPDIPSIKPNNETQQIEVTVTAWPSDGYCPSMVPT